MEYEEYVKLQIGSPVKKLWKSRVGQRKAIDWFFKHIYKDVSILDVGCAVGTGMRHLHKLGFKNVVGIDMHPKKIEICRRRNLQVFCMDVLMPLHQGPHYFDLVWLSHVFEHMQKPKKALQRLRRQTKPNTLFFFVLPYPDLTPAQAHCASVEIGSNIDDEGKTLIQWFENNGLNFIHKKFDGFREPEIWLQFRKR